MKLIQSIPLCSRCIVNEIAGWVFDNQLKFNPDVIREIREELKDIKLKEGDCIVCSKKLVSEDLTERVFRILEKDKVPEGLVEEFRKLFFY